jgi:hypothetical protein
MERVVVSNSLLSDVVLQFYPWDTATQAELRAGRFPWVNRLAGEGEPLWANPQAALMSPFTWPRLALGIKGWTWSVLLKLILAGVGMFLFARDLGAGPGAAALSGAVYQLSGYEVLWGLYPITNVFSLLPWLGVSALRLLRRPSMGTAAATIAAAAAATAGGHPETLALGVTGLAMFVLFEARVEKRRRGRPAVALVVGAAAAGFLLLAVQLVPFAVLLKDSRFAHERANSAAAGRLRVVAIASQVLPGFLGTPLEGEIDLGGLFRGSENLNLRSGGFVGFVPLVALLLVAKRLPASFRRGLIVGGVALLISWRVPPLGWIWSRLPGVQLFVPEYAVLVFVFFAALAAGPALQHVGRMASGRALRFLAVALVAGGGLLVVAGLCPLVPPGRKAFDVEVREGVARLREIGYLKASPEIYERRTRGYIQRARTTAWRRLALPGICWAVAGAVLLSRKRPPWLLASAAIGELVVFGYGYLPAVSVERIPAEPDAIAFLRGASAAGDVVIAAASDSYAPDLPTLAGIRDVRSNCLLESREFLERLAACGYDPRFQTFPNVLSGDNAACLARLGVRFYCSRAEQPEARRVGGGPPPAVGVYELKQGEPPGEARVGPPPGFRAGLAITGLAAAAAVALCLAPARRRGPDTGRNPAGRTRAG